MVAVFYSLFLFRHFKSVTSEMSGGQHLKKSLMVLKGDACGFLRGEENTMIFFSFAVFCKLHASIPPIFISLPFFHPNDILDVHISYSTTLGAAVRCRMLINLTRNQVHFTLP